MKVSPESKMFFREVALKRLSFLGLLVPIERLASSKLIKILQYLKLQYLKTSKLQYLKSSQYLKPISQTEPISQTYISKQPNISNNINISKVNISNHPISQSQTEKPISQTLFRNRIGLGKHSRTLLPPPPLLLLTSPPLHSPFSLPLSLYRSNSVSD